MWESLWTGYWIFISVLQRKGGSSQRVSVSSRKQCKWHPKLTIYEQIVLRSIENKVLEKQKLS
jgi:hypothetical protein